MADGLTLLARMMNSVVEINRDSIGISVSKGFLLVKETDAEEKIPLSDIETLIINSYGAYISNKAIMRLGENNIPIIHCAQNAMPIAITLPYADNVYRKERIEAQVQSSLPLRKKLWQLVTKAKIRNQAAVLDFNKLRNIDLLQMADKVQSGDVGNLEAAAARLYWERLFGKGFKRHPDIPGINGFLNYGYAIIRASMCRCIVASGFIPDLGIHHHNQMNPFCLADDLMEPFRPFIDLCVKAHFATESSVLNASAKKELISLLDLPLNFQDTDTHLRYCLQRAVADYMNSLYAKKAAISYPCINRDTLHHISGG